MTYLEKNYIDLLLFRMYIDMHIINLEFQKSRNFIDQDEIEHALL